MNLKSILKICIVGVTMIVCLCKGVSERDIGEAIRRGACSIDDIRRHCQGAGGDCGSCRGDIKAQLIERATPRAA